MSIPGFGPITASALATTIQDTSGFAGRCKLAPHLGLLPKQNSSGGKQKLGCHLEDGQPDLRKLFVVGAHAVLFHSKPHTAPLRMRAKRLLEKTPACRRGVRQQDGAYCLCDPARQDGLSEISA